MADRAKWAGLAVDLGASSGRVMAGTYDGSRLDLREASRFDNGPVQVHDTIYWDTLRLFDSVQKGLVAAGAALRKSGCAPASVGIDTWGVDFGLLDADGRLLSNPVHYRDSRTDGMVEKVYAEIPRAEFYGVTGLQTMQLNTLFQLCALRDARSAQLDSAEAMLFTPDLFHYFLCGEKASEYTIASTSQLLDARKRDWAWDLIERLGLPRRIFQPVVRPGTVLGPVLPSMREVLGGLDLRVVAVGSHDTASAVAAVPAEGGTFAYLSCGTWSLLGAEVAEPSLSARSQELNFTNEGGLNNTIRLLKNIMGLWLAQELRREWNEAGRSVSWTAMTQAAGEARPFLSWIDPDDARFLAPGPMSPRIRDYCQGTGQVAPESDGAFARCILESLALKYRQVLENLDQLVGQKLPVLHMVGGGIQNQLLCQWTANAINRPVKAGPVEATALGNLMAQLMAAGEIASVQEGRRIISASEEVRTYEPEDTVAWEDAYAKYREVTEN